MKGFANTDLHSEIVTLSNKICCKVHYSQKTRKDDHAGTISYGQFIISKKTTLMLVNGLGKQDKRKMFST